MKVKDLKLMLENYRDDTEIHCLGCSSGFYFIRTPVLELTSLEEIEKDLIKKNHAYKDLPEKEYSKLRLFIK